MTDGGVMAGRITSGSFGPETLSTYVQAPSYKNPAFYHDKGFMMLSIQGEYKRRFGDNVPTATLPTERQ